MHKNCKICGIIIYGRQPHAKYCTICADALIKKRGGKHVHIKRDFVDEFEDIITYCKE